jgi:uncharacterized protein
VVKLSRTAFLAPIPDRDLTLLVQPLTGQAALLSRAAATAVAGLEHGSALPADVSLEDLRAAAFVVERDEEDDALAREARTAFEKEQANTPAQLVLVPSFACNLACTYCYQEPFEPVARGLIAPEALDAFFAYVDQFHASEAPRPYITLFGGEPLVDTPAHRDRVMRILEGARIRGLTVAVVTNGHDVGGYVHLLRHAPIREVQVTIDGPRDVHDRRRPHGSGAATFDRVVRGVDALLDASMPVNLRVVVDRDNLPALPALARVAEERGWLDLPEDRFKTQIGRNYELFGCAPRQRRDELLGRVELWTEYVRLADREAVLRRFHRPRFHGIGHLAATGELPAPNFDGCPATKKEWAFAPDGGLYGCTATVGHPAHRLGSFYPSVVHDDAAIARWAGRSTSTIPACARCAVAPVCGGGCGALAWRRGGDVLAPDCRPVPELMALGARYYGLSD